MGELGDDGGGGTLRACCPTPCGATACSLRKLFFGNRWADPLCAEHGYTGIRLEAGQLLDPVAAQAERVRVAIHAAEELNQGKGVIVYSALGPDDPQISKLRGQRTGAGMVSTDTGRLLGEQLGQIGRDIIQRSRVTRAVIAGGTPQVM